MSFLRHLCNEELDRGSICFILSPLSERSQFYQSICSNVLSPHLQILVWQWLSDTVYAQLYSFERPVALLWKWYSASLCHLPRAPVSWQNREIRERLPSIPLVHLNLNGWSECSAFFWFNERTQLLHQSVLSGFNEGFRLHVSTWVEAMSRLSRTTVLGCHNF